MAVSGSVHASESDTLKLHEVTVYGTPKALKLELTPLSVSIIDANQIEKSTESNILPVLANHVPGFFVTERGILGFGVSGEQPEESASVEWVGAIRCSS